MYTIYALLAVLLSSLIPVLNNWKEWMSFPVSALSQSTVPQCKIVDRCKLPDSWISSGPTGRFVAHWCPAERKKSVSNFSHNCKRGEKNNVSNFSCSPSLKSLFEGNCLSILVKFLSIKVRTFIHTFWFGWGSDSANFVTHICITFWLKNKVKRCWR